MRSSLRSPRLIGHNSLLCLSQMTRSSINGTLRYVTRRKARRYYASIADQGYAPNVGDKFYGFTLRRTKDVPEFRLKAYHLQHDQTSAEYIHIAKEDPNNAFSIGFKTNPPDRTGLPHILEHTTLCGSEKYV